MLAQRSADVVQMLYKCFVFAAGYPENTTIEQCRCFNVGSLSVADSGRIVAYLFCYITTQIRNNILYIK